MIHHPTLDRTAVSFADTRYTISYKNDYHRPEDPELDESHIHGCYEIYFNLSGDVAFLVNNRIYAVQSGDVVFTAPGDVHLCIYNKACVHEHFCLWIQDSEDSAVITFLRNSFSEHQYSFLKERERLTELFHRLRSCEDPSLRQTALFLRLLTLLSDGGEKLPHEDQPLIPIEMQRIVDDINEHFVEFRHISDVQKRHYVSRATLDRWFRKYIHLSPKEFLEAKKLSYAKSLLENGTSVTDACIRAGFSDCSHFIALFRRRFGQTPLQFKNDFSSK